MAPVYTSEQVDKYLEYIEIPPKYRRSANPAIGLEFLTALHVHQISAIPYENLALHYSVDHRVSLDPQVLLSKATQNGRGGYCMENSILFHHVLRALGFQVYLAGARPRVRKDGIPHGDYLGWAHIVNIVTLPDGTIYVVDVAFGGDGPTMPLALTENQVSSNIGSQKIRLVHDSIPEQLEKSKKVWIYQYRNSTDLPWNSFYCFYNVEFVYADFEVMNWYASTHPDSFQTHMVLIVKFLRQEEHIYGKVMLIDGVVKQNTGGKTKVVKTCTTEKERLEALKTYFGIELTSAEQKGIRGQPSELLAS